MKRGFWALACVGVAQAGSVNAMDSCVGRYSAALISALPVPTVVAVDVPDSTPTNSNLVQAFTQGMTEAGQNTSSSPTAKLVLTYQVTGQGGGGGNDGSDQPGGTAGGWSNWSGSNMPGLQGGETGLPIERDRNRAAQIAAVALTVHGRGTWPVLVRCSSRRL